MIRLARPQPGPAVVEALAILALLTSSLTFPSWWWRAPVLALGVALAALLLRKILRRPSVKLDFTTLTIKTPTRTTTVHRRDVLSVVPLRAARPGAPNLRLRFRDDTTRVDLNAERPDAAVREILDWIGKGPAKGEARHLLLTRLADTMHVKIKSAKSRGARRAGPTRPPAARVGAAQADTAQVAAARVAAARVAAARVAAARADTAQVAAARVGGDRADTARVGAGRHVPSRRSESVMAGAAAGSWHARTVLLSRLAVALRSLEAARAAAAESLPLSTADGWSSTASGPAVSPATPNSWLSTASYPAYSPTVFESWQSSTSSALGSPTAPADPTEARRLALARMASALHAATRSAHARTTDDRTAS